MVMITCPYCFESFGDDEVMFRMPTVTKEISEKKLEDRLNNGELTDSEYKNQLAQAQLNNAFAPKQDPVYTQWWSAFGGTTENDASLDGVAPYLHRVYSFAHDPQYFNTNRGLLRTAEGMVYAAYDRFDKKTDNRVCPHCHNPLPGLFGQYDVVSIAVIGITGAGKTVYLSQLCQCISSQLANYGITVNMANTALQQFMTDNPVRAGKPLPTPTESERFQQPVVLDLGLNDPATGTSWRRTLVFYDIAGENTVPNAAGVAEGMKQFGPFIGHANGMILLIDPDQLKSATEDRQKNLNAVTQTLHNYFQFDESKLRNMPFAVCLSKGDMAVEDIFGSDDPLPDMTFLTDRYGEDVPTFNAGEYNKLRANVSKYIEDRAIAVGFKDFILGLHRNYLFNYFIVSAIGGNTTMITNEQGAKVAVPVAPQQIRLIEPLAWILYQLKLIGASEHVMQSDEWQCPKCHNWYELYKVKFCPNCRINDKGQWQCPKCQTMNDDSAEMCVTRGCKTNRYGQHKGLFGWK